MKPYILSTDSQDDTRADACRSLSKEIARHTIAGAKSKGLNESEALIAICVAHATLMVTAGASRKDSVAIYDSVWEEVERITLQQAARMRAVAEPVFGNFLDLIGRPQRRIALRSHL